MSKRDLKKELKALYQPSSKHVEEVDVPTLHFLMIDGEGDPNTSPDYAAAIEALFTVSYTVKFIVKKGPLAIDYGVMPLEGLWWADDMAAFNTGEKSRWKWTMMIMQPDFVTQDLIDQAMVSARKKLGAEVLSRLRWEPCTEGRCAQTLHVGPFTSEGPTIERVHQFIATRGSLSGKHHEIYLSDIRKADPSKWKTIIRQPMQEAPPPSTPKV